MEREPRERAALLPETERLLAWVETSTGRTVVVEADPEVRPRGRALYVVSDSDPSRHLVKYDPLYEATRDALIAHECGHIAMFSRAGSDGRVAVVTRASRERALDRLAPEIEMLRRRGSSISWLREAVPIWVGGTVAQLVDTPADMSIEAWLWNKWPALRSTQEASLRDQTRTYALALGERVREVTPPTVWDASMRMNGRLVRTYAQLLGDSRLTAPWGRAGFRESAGLRADGDLVHLEASHALTRSWEREFGVEGWFEWRRLAEVRGAFVVME